MNTTNHRSSERAATVFSNQKAQTMLSCKHVMMSARFLGDADEGKARALFRNLRDGEKINVYMVEADAGEEFGQATADGLGNMEVMIAFITSNYGEKTGSRFCSFYEVKWCYEYDIPVVPIQVCPEWPPGRSGGPGTNMIKLLLTPSVIRLNWSNKEWDAAACAKEVAQKLRNLVEKGIISGEDIFLEKVDPTAGVGAQVDVELSTLLQKLDLSDAVEPLAKYGIKSVAHFNRLNERMLKEMVADHGLPAFHKGLILEHVTQGGAG
eukprot:CAMPEP_0181294948 /NCGR_PEP_ID=MMETSP1101-20121128/3879_1 /TAXON_ID=46948 /ORGANISM="Rhodomonas abbreviata, Strain Caron Lab Isolate" /LENGTH=265 /DNA_ID=CAMNT_0023399653 /DNA_START=102 /DNA_END=895 /DNA_ORIENTATION=+